MKNKSLLLKNVVDFIINRGVKGWNMDDLAAESGITKRTLYKMIDSKEKLIEESIIQKIDKTQYVLIEVLEKDAPYIAKLKDAINILPEMIFGVYSSYFKLVFLEYPAIEKTIVERRRIFIERFSVFLNTGIEKGVINNNANPSEIIELIQAIVLYYIKINDSENSMKKKAARGIKILFYGIINESHLKEFV